MAYNFDLKLRAEGSKWEVLVDTTAAYGYFEHDDEGEGGGLWFERQDDKLELMDFDGRYCLPKGVAKALRADPRFVVGTDFD